MSEEQQTLVSVLDVDAMIVSCVSVDCPHCNAPQGGWFDDPRGGEGSHKCDDCGGLYRVPDTVDIRF